MNSGSAPHTTRSSTTMPTRSKPMVSCTSMACATATLVPTPSVEVASSGRRYDVSALASNSPANPPMPPTTSGRDALATHAFISSTARSPASMSTPAAAYDATFPGPSVTPRPYRRTRGDGSQRGERGVEDPVVDDAERIEDLRSSSGLGRAVVGPTGPVVRHREQAPGASCLPDHPQVLERGPRRD